MRRRSYQNCLFSGEKSKEETTEDVEEASTPSVSK